MRLSVSFVLASLMAVAQAGCHRAECEAARQTVTAYLEACRTGDVDTAEGLLSAVAQQRTAEAGIDVTFARSDTAAFEVGEAEVRDTSTIEVASTWIDQGEIHPIYWAVRQDEDGWRITGMAASEPGEDRALTWMDFEAPETLKNW
jgi:hypothetical protein